MNISHEMSQNGGIHVVHYVDLENYDCYVVVAEPGEYDMGQISRPREVEMVRGMFFLNGEESYLKSPHDLGSSLVRRFTIEPGQPFKIEVPDTVCFHICSGHPEDEDVEV